MCGYGAGETGKRRSCGGSQLRRCGSTEGSQPFVPGCRGGSALLGSRGNAPARCNSLAFFFAQERRKKESRYDIAILLPATRVVGRAKSRELLTKIKRSALPFSGFSRLTTLYFLARKVHQLAVVRAVAHGWEFGQQVPPVFFFRCCCPLPPSSLNDDCVGW